MVKLTSLTRKDSTEQTMQDLMQTTAQRNLIFSVLSIIILLKDIMFSINKIYSVLTVNQQTFS